jgi:Zn-dependent M28 family amino/carboxypeptidase
MSKKKQALHALVLLVMAGAAALCTSYMTATPGASHPAGPLSLDEEACAKRLKRHVEELTKIGERRAKTAGSLKRAEEYLFLELRHAGFYPDEQRFGVRGDQFQNIQVEVAGLSSPKEILVVGAHYDTARRTPGADDNASGCAILIELARALRGNPGPRTVRLVLFSLGESPHLGSEEMGSRAWLRASEQRGEKIAAMLSLDSLGIYSDAPGSQHYPLPLNFYYPDRGDFVGFLGDLRSRDLVRACVRSFRDAGRMPAEGLAAPGWLPGMSSSDHWAFRRSGIPAVLVSDTMGWRNLSDHGPLDLAPSLDYASMARVVTSLVQVVRDLQRPTALP